MARLVSLAGLLLLCQGKELRTPKNIFKWEHELKSRGKSFDVTLSSLLRYDMIRVDNCEHLFILRVLEYCVVGSNSMCCICSR